MKTGLLGSIGVSSIGRIPKSANRRALEPAGILSFVALVALLAVSAGCTGVSTVEEAEEPPGMFVRGRQGEWEHRCTLSRKDAAWSVTVEKGQFENPKRRVIANRASWEQTWAALRHAREVPEVDFSKDLVYIDSVSTSDRNSRSLTFYVSDRGSLYVSDFTTLVYYKPSGSVRFDFYLIPRTGIRRILRYDLARRDHVVVPLE